ncbi:hypothetical protein V1478_012526 [Vespula squamosa]|uniref:Uncharacterized protein n=1 Tax=Vespula squamosa TaxID=30214 RepID=A0ABD2ADQ0_VESSQ
MAVCQILQEMVENWPQITSDRKACEIARRVWSECHKVPKNDVKEIEIKIPLINAESSRTHYQRLCKTCSQRIRNHI